MRVPRPTKKLADFAKDDKHGAKKHVDADEEIASPTERQANVRRDRAEKEDVEEHVPQKESPPRPLDTRSPPAVENGFRCRRAKEGGLALERELGKEAAVKLL